MSINRQGRIGRHRGEDEGFSLIELIVVVSLLGIVTPVLLSIFVNGSDIAKKVDTKTQALAAARLALETIARDLRAANPIDAILATTPHPLGTTLQSVYDTQISFSVYCANAGVGDCRSTNLRLVKYVVTSNRLDRVTSAGTGMVIGPSGPPAVPSNLQQNAIVNTVAQPIFKYYDARGVQLVTSGASPAPVTSFRDCARAVEIHLYVISEPNDSTNPVDLTTRVTLRNFNQIRGC